MHETPADFQHPLLALALLVGNIPVYILLGRLFFGSWQDLVDCVRGVAIVDRSFRLWYRPAQRPPPDREVDGLYAALRLLLFVLLSLACVGAEYRSLAWLLYR